VDDMTTSEIVKGLSSRFKLPQTEIKKLLTSTIHILRGHLINQDKYTLPGLGTFDIAERKERKSYNPHHKKVMLFPKKVVAVFRPSKRLQDQIKQDLA
jgi:DNA-binding protein HU-beta